MNIRTAGFFGGHAFNEQTQEYKDAKETAKLLAKSGLMVINGGGPGIMRASTQGAHEGGGEVLAVTCYYGGWGRANFEGVDKLNKFDKEIIADNYFVRTQRLLEMGDVHIVFRGGSGTISEWGMTWAMSRIHEGGHKPIILFGEFWREIMEVVTKKMLIQQGKESLYTIVKKPDEVLDLINSYRDR